MPLAEVHTSGSLTLLFVSFVFHRKWLTQLGQWNKKLKRFQARNDFQIDIKFFFLIFNEFSYESNQKSKWLDLVTSGMASEHLNHLTTKAQMTNRIFKITLIHGSVILYILWIQWKIISM